MFSHMVISFDQALEDGGEEIIFAKVFVVRKLLEKYAGMAYIKRFRSDDSFTTITWLCAPCTERIHG